MTPDSDLRDTTVSRTLLGELQARLRASTPGSRGELLASFAGALHARTTGRYFTLFTPEQLEAGVVSMLEHAATSPREGFSIRVFRPEWLAPPGRRDRWAIEVAGPDQPFLVDTLRELLRVRSHPVLDVFHPILSVRRAADGSVESIRPAREGGALVSFIHAETQELSESEAHALEAEAREVFEEARRVSRDFRPMVSRVKSTVSRLRESVQREVDLERRDDLSEAADFLEWLLSSNFVFLGARKYAVHGEGDARTVQVVSGSGLGILDDDSTSSMREPRPLDALPRDLRRRVESREPLAVFKTNRESRVLRRASLDYIGIKEIGKQGHISKQGQVVGEERFLGLFTARALGELPARIPLLRRKLQRIIRETGVVPGSHDHKEIFSTFCSLPKAQLFLYDARALQKLVLEIVDSRDQQGVRVLYQSDLHGLHLAVMVLLPRERFNAQARQDIQQLLAREFHAKPTEYNLALSEEPLARLHFYFSVAPDAHQTPSISDLEAKIDRLTRTWPERLAETLKAHFDLGKGTYLADRYALAFPAGYVAQESPEVAADDVKLLEAAVESSRPAVRVVNRIDETGEEITSIRVARPREPFRLSALMPTLTNLGLDVLDESTHRIKSRHCEDPTWLHTFRTLDPQGDALGDGEAARHLEETILAVLEERSADDGLNALVPLAGTTWREVDVLRTYTAYLQQVELTLRQRSAFAALLDHPDATRAVLALFRSRFDPELETHEREAGQHAARDALARALENVPGIQEDRILRSYENAILATVRTNAFRTSEAGEPPPALAVKIRCADVTRMPLPRPLFEIFVANAAFEGVHLRSGKVARGGIRWSDRSDDFRTEILGLMRAQRTKNALIVPVGAKGGFVLRANVAPERTATEVRRRYEQFIEALLDVTDDVVDGRATHPPSTVIHDEEDPYLVVAADRGTAQFSDIANAIAERRGFWLRDAFASGGSTGYNHKDEGITARGAWECVKRHFLGLGRDTQSEEFTVVGIGDMSGDVFGNGMLLSRKIRLVAAFNHEHIFLDPSPDAERSFVERERLFRLPRSRWSDYDSRALSPGGGIHPRHAKRIELTAEVRRLLETDRAEMNGTELVRAVLRLPVDLLWNGGIGTYVKATEETNAEVGDVSNDGVRIDARELRALVVGEGGNLGLTPRARVEASRAGVILNTDFLDNSAGVDLSDHEVNLKVLLDLAVKDGTLEPAARPPLIRELTGEICDMVLADNRLQCDAVTVEVARGAAALAPVRRLFSELEDRGLLIRHLEAVPDDTELRRMESAGEGLSRPHACVLLAFAKIDAFSRVIGTGLADRASFAEYAERYFPAVIRERFPEEIRGHALRREIILTGAVNTCLNRMGATFLHRLAHEEDRTLAEALEAWHIVGRFAMSERFHVLVDAATSRRLEPPEVLRERTTRFLAALEGAIRWCLRRCDTTSDGLSLPASAPDDAPARDERLPTSSASLLGEASILLERIEALADTFEASTLAELARSSEAAAREALASADARLGARGLVHAAAAARRRTPDDWQMLCALERAILDLRLALAREAIERVGREGGDVESAVRAVLPDDSPARRAAVDTARRAEAGQQLEPSSLFVVVDALRRVTPALDAPPGTR